MQYLIEKSTSDQALCKTYGSLSRYFMSIMIVVRLCIYYIPKQHTNVLRTSEMVR